MKKMYFLFSVVCAGLMLLASTNRLIQGKYGFVTGTPEIRSINSLAFGPEGVLFIGDSKSAVIFAIDTKDAVAKEQVNAV